MQGALMGSGWGQLAKPMLSNLINPQTEVSIRIRLDSLELTVLIVFTRHTTVIKVKVDCFNPEYFGIILHTVNTY